MTKIEIRNEAFVKRNAWHLERFPRQRRVFFILEYCDRNSMNQVQKKTQPLSRLGFYLKKLIVGTIPAGRPAGFHLSVNEVVLTSNVQIALHAF
jgi:hypothetical protein